MSADETASSPKPWARLHPVLTHHIVNSLGWRSLRPLQREAIDPILNGDDALLLAPTAGGKTEAACFPLLSAMEQQAWQGMSVLYVCPLKALLNNLLPRLETYTSWIGRRAGIWHGDVNATARRRLLRDPPDVLLTTPESLEAMLVSDNVDHVRLLGNVRVIVVDEVHSFAGDDRGWHLLAVLERLTRVTRRPIQRVGLSATVGNPDDLLGWLQGSSQRRGSVVAPGTEAMPSAHGNIELDYVGSVDNAATVIAALHRGEKRLVFCDSRKLVEEIGSALRTRGVTTFLSHASLSVDERRSAEQAFAEARDCVIVSTSTLELGLDVGDLDRVIQINAPGSVASFLQRLGRSGRRAGSTRNCLFLALRGDSVLWSAALLLLWQRGYVEPVTAPPQPRHIMAQQILALCLQNHSIADTLWSREWNGLAPFDTSAEPILRHLLNEGFLERDDTTLFVGPEAERRFGRRHFMELTAVFTAPPQFAVLEGRREIGHTDPALLTERTDGPRRLLLGGRSWTVTGVDWARRRCYVEPSDEGGRAHWHTPGQGGAGYALTQAARDVLLGADPEVSLTHRAKRVLAALREDRSSTVCRARTVITRGAETRWWTWGGYRTNAMLTASLGDLTSEDPSFTEVSIRLRGELTREMWHDVIAGISDRLCLPEVDGRALRGLKFSDALPDELAQATLAARLADPDGARAVLESEVRFVDVSSG